MTTTAAVEVAGRGAAAREDVVSRMRRPVFLLVAEDGSRREALTTDLRRRYDAAVRIAGPAHSARSHRLRDVLSRGGVPYRFFDDGSAEGRQLLRETGAEGARRPVAVYYDGTVLADPSTGQEVFVIGAANSAGQAALHLATHAKSVTMLVRGPGLHPGMSEYLITEIGKTANIAVRPATEVIDGGGHGSLETLTLRHRPGGATEVVPASALFVMIGTEPRTQWLEGSVTRDPQGFVLTGRDLSPPGRRPERWPLSRPPLLLETSIPGVFAAGDVRHRSVKRVASAIGEGAIAVQLLHEYLYLQAGHE
jgi:thioredoxin reductase (NADPH)